MSKGSKRRPGDLEAYRENWDRIFGPARRDDADSVRRARLNDAVRDVTVYGRIETEVPDSGETPC
jgi:hypothetical protein